MKKTTIMMAILSACSMQGLAQQKGGADLENIDWDEDSTKVITIADIMKVQQDVSSLGRRQTHFEEVWRYRTYLNISYSNNKLTPKEDIPLGIGTQIVPEFKSNWGVSLKWGNNYRLHKKPIANIVSINLDFTWTDLSVSHYKAEGDTNMYDSRNTFSWAKDDDEEAKDYHYLPWQLEKYDFNYGMSLGPSVTVAPFTMLNVRGLHHLKLNLYYHIGYSASLLLMKNDKGKADINPESKRPTFTAQQPQQPQQPYPSSYSTQEEYDQAQAQYLMAQAQYEAERVQYNQRAEDYNTHESLSSSKLVIGHGLTHSFGFNISWKFIGLGYERRNSTMRFQSLDTGNFSNQKYKFKTASSRIYLQFRF